jgi:hypothetical protein
MITRTEALAWNKAYVKHACPKYYRLMLCRGRVPIHLLHSPIVFRCILAKFQAGLR